MTNREPQQKRQVFRARKLAALQLGERGEAAVGQWYLDRGFEIVERNWRCFEGEIDLIVRKGPTLVFCEVKTRSNERFVSGAQAVDYRKQAKLRTAAFRWLADQPWHKQLRFDVAVVVGDSIRVIENAF